MSEPSKGKSGSKFSGLLAAVKEREEDQAENQAEEARTETQDAPKQPAAAIGMPMVKEEPPGKEEPVREGPVRGRPRGKRSSDEFVQVTAYIGKQTHRKVKIALLSEGDQREFSELVEDLLAQWLRTQI